MALQFTGIDHLSVACSAPCVGKKSDTDAPSPMIQAAAEKIYRLAQDKGLTIEELAPVPPLAPSIDAPPERLPDPRRALDP